MIRSFPGRVNIRMIPFERKIRAPVLQREAAASGHDGGAETAVDAVDEGTGVAVAVRDGEVDCVAGLVGRAAVREVVRWERCCWVEEAGAGGEVGS